MSSIQISNRDLSVSLYPATVIHADKYTDTRGGAFDLPVRTTLHNDVVFRSKQTNEDWPVHIRNLNLPIYSNQDVILIAVEETIIGYIDTRTDLYYYTSTDFVNNFDLGIHPNKIWITGVLTAIALFFFLPEEKNLLFFLPLIGMYFFYRIHKTLLNYRAEKAMDSFLSSR
ncbi:MAG: hypothetical protein V4557_07475 [Bacteroidota bacterium]